MTNSLIALICGLFINISILSGQSSKQRLLLGEYEGLEIRFLKTSSDTTDRVDRLNKTWGTKKLTLDSNGTFRITFPIPWPSTITGERITKGTWSRKNDTLILNSYFLYKDFMRVQERKKNLNQIKIQIKYKGDKNFYPNLELRVNDQTKMTDNKKWNYFTQDTVSFIKIDPYYKVNDHKWKYKVQNKNSNHFVIKIEHEIDGNNFVVENYRLLIKDNSLIQIDKEFDFVNNCFKAINFR